jgi:hypothetical protein
VYCTAGGVSILLGGSLHADIEFNIEFNIYESSHSMQFSCIHCIPTSSRVVDVVRPRIAIIEGFQKPRRTFFAPNSVIRYCVGVGLYSAVLA